MSLFRPLPLACRVRWFSTRKRHKLPLRVISTVNPLSLQPNDFLDLSGRHLPSIGFGAALEGPNPTIPYRSVGARRAPFPPQSHGFLYFHRDPDAAPLEGGLRFRLSENELPSSFKAGRDLLLPTGLPWQLILPQLLRPRFQKVIAELQRENLITTAQITRCHGVFGRRRYLFPAFILFRLAQEFPVDFGIDPSLSIVAELLLEVRLFPFSFRPGARERIFPFTGTGLARFEPLVTADGRRVVHLRITKIMTPVVCKSPEYLERIAEPKEGELLTVAPRGGAARPWELDIDQDTERAAALGALWPTTRVP
ncbi:hypothetical protein C8R46DRAFT_1344595 [Mycena filopes]|nr:hypothetical protein C8R46DRAFT_1344595 [Mycena filopes]